MGPSSGVFFFQDGIFRDFFQNWKDFDPQLLSVPHRVGLPGLRPWRHRLADVHEMRGTMRTPGSRVARVAWRFPGELKITGSHVVHFDSIFMSLSRRYIYIYIILSNIIVISW